MSRECQLWCLHSQLQFSKGPKFLPSRWSRDSSDSRTDIWPFPFLTSRLQAVVLVTCCILDTAQRQQRRRRRRGDEEKRFVYPEKMRKRHRRFLPALNDAITRLPSCLVSYRPWSFLGLISSWNCILYTQLSTKTTRVNGRSLLRKCRSTTSSTFDTKTEALLARTTPPPSKVKST